MTPRGQEPVRRQGEQGDSALRENAPAKYAPEGLDAKAKICAASARGGDISLDIPFYRPTGIQFEFTWGGRRIPLRVAAPSWLTAIAQVLAEMANSWAISLSR